MHRLSPQRSTRILIAPMTNDQKHPESGCSLSVPLSGVTIQLIVLHLHLRLQVKCLFDQCTQTRIVERSRHLVKAIATVVAHRLTQTGTHNNRNTYPAIFRRLYSGMWKNDPIHSCSLLFDIMPYAHPIKGKRSSGGVPPER